VSGKDEWQIESRCFFQEESHSIIMNVTNCLKFVPKLWAKKVNTEIIRADAVTMM